MKKRTISGIKQILIFFLLVFIFPFSAQSETGYVTDMLILTVKEGPGNEYGVINTLRSNTRVDIIKKTNNYYQIKTTEGDEGWVESQYITSEIPKSIIIENLQAKITSLEKKMNPDTDKDSASRASTWETKIEALNKAHQEQTAKLEFSLKNAEERNIKLAEAVEQAQQKYSGLASQSDNLVNIIKENKELSQQNTILSKELESLKLKNENSTRTSMIKWFLAGAGVLLIGWLIGLSIRSGSKKKQSGILG